MIPLKVVLLPEAEAEIRAAILWYSERSPLLADAFRAVVFEAIEGLATTAFDWPQLEDSTRHYHLSRYPYTLMYEVMDIEVIILAVAHQRRRPGYWRER